MAEFYIGQVSEHAVILNDHGEILLLQHNGGGDALNIHYGKWHLPGGRLDYDDQPGLALLREIKEETGLTEVELIGPCHASRWGFDEPVKYSVAYLAQVKGKPTPVLAEHEHHMAYEWVKPQDLAGREFLHEKHAEVIAGVLKWARKLGVVGV